MLNSESKSQGAFAEKGGLNQLDLAP